MRRVEKLVCAAFAVTCALWPLDFFGVAPFTVWGLPFGWHFFPEIVFCFLGGWIIADYALRYAAAVFAFYFSVPVIFAVVYSFSLVVFVQVLIYAAIIGIVPSLLGFALSDVFFALQKKKCAS